MNTEHFARIDRIFEKERNRCIVLCAAVFAVCFMEHADQVTGAVTQVLQKAAWKWFHVAPDKVFLWKYSGRSLNSEHFLYLLNDIGKALVCVSVILLS